jgi:spore coat polysaccharide biosynthesis protein SpsF
MLAQQVRRLQCCAVDEIVVATTVNTADDPVIDVCRKAGVAWYRGSEHDVLGRFVGAARQAHADVIVRVTADCPLIDPAVTNQVIAALLDNAEPCDYAGNVLERTYPRGLDAEALFLDTLLRVDRLAKSPAAREHVTLMVYSERPELFLRRSVTDVQNNADLRWTVDTPEDLEMARTLYTALDLGTTVLPYPEILSYVRAHPEVAQLNAGIETWTPPQ